MYTRVSIKEQADNNQSLFTKAKHIKQFAMNNDLQIIGEFGGTYESAKSDERIQFKQMIAFVKRHKVGAIIVYSMDRFSRSSANSIYISEQLRKVSTEITSVTQPVDATTAAGELQQSIYFMFSQYENKQRRLKCMAGTLEKLLHGDWVTVPPFRYKIVKEKGKRDIVITKEGRLLAAAFRRKIKYNYEFTEISIWLAIRGLKINAKRLTELSRNIFYCGYMAHKALEGGDSQRQPRRYYY
ncbi:MAG: site-specific DNA recombinase [Bacteroidia bacterium]|jgi:site-specific DNA recombinase